MNNRQKLKKLKQENERLQRLILHPPIPHIPLFMDRITYKPYMCRKMIPRELYCDEVIAPLKKDMARMFAEYIEKEMEFNISDEGYCVTLEARILIGKKL